MRLFIAIELPPSIKAEAIRLQGRLRDEVSLPLRWVPADGIHLTLKFLGEVEDDRRCEVESALGRAATRGQPLTITLGSGGSFDGRRLRVVWLALTGEIDRLRRLQSAIDEEVAGLGFPPERRGFDPHLTLARVPDGLTGRDRLAVLRAVESLRPERETSGRVEQVALMRSTLLPSGARHERLAAVALGANP